MRRWILPGRRTDPQTHPAAIRARPPLGFNFHCARPDGGRSRRLDVPHNEELRGAIVWITPRSSILVRPTVGPASD